MTHARPIARAVALSLALLSASSRVGSAQTTVQPLLPGEKAYGLTLEEWAVAWVQWLVSIPAATHPNTDTSGRYSGIGQRMPVWFVAGAEDPGPSYTRTVYIPAGAAIMIPAYGGAALNRPGVKTEEELRAGLRGDGNFELNAEVTLDGVVIPDLHRYEVETPLFTAVLPPNNLLGLTVTPGNDPRVAAVADGSFLLIPPLTLGRHVLHVQHEGSADGQPFKVQVVTTLIVREPNERKP